MVGGVTADHVEFLRGHSAPDGGARADQGTVAVHLRVPPDLLRTGHPGQGARFQRWEPILLEHHPFALAEARFHGLAQGEPPRKAEQVDPGSPCAQIVDIAADPPVDLDDVRAVGTQLDLGVGDRGVHFERFQSAGDKLQHPGAVVSGQWVGPEVPGLPKRRGQRQFAGHRKVCDPSCGHDAFDGHVVAERRQVPAGQVSLHHDTGVGRIGAGGEQSVDECLSPLRIVDEVDVPAAFAANRFDHDREVHFRHYCGPAGRVGQVDAVDAVDASFGEPAPLRVLVGQQPAPPGTGQAEMLRDRAGLADHAFAERHHAVGSR